GHPVPGQRGGGRPARGRGDQRTHPRVADGTPDRGRPTARGARRAGHRSRGRRRRNRGAVRGRHPRQARGRRHRHRARPGDPSPGGLQGGAGGRRMTATHSTHLTHSTHIRPDVMHQVTLADVLRDHTRNRPGSLGAVCGEYRLDFPALDARVNQLAHALAGAGVGEGDRLLWLGQNCHRLIEGLLAAAKVGAVFCPANWRQSADEFAFVVNDADPSVVFWQEAEIGETLRQVRQDTGSKALWLQHDGEGDGSYEAFISTAPTIDPGVAIDEATAVLMMYTAAFTGSPNGALLSHRALVVQGSFMAQIQGVGADYVYLNCGPLFHVATFMTTLATFLSGGTNVFTPRADAEELCRLISEEGCAGGFIMGHTMDQIIELNADGRYNLKTLRAF